MEPSIPNLNDHLAPLPINWALRFIHNQLFRYFQFPSRFCPGWCSEYSFSSFFRWIKFNFMFYMIILGAFHSTITRKAEFRSPLVSGTKSIVIELRVFNIFIILLIDYSVLL